MVYPPSSLVCTERVSPVSVCLAVTVVPGITAPVLSRTKPEMAAEKFCPNTKPPANRITPTIPISVVANLMKSFFLQLTMTPLSLIWHTKIQQLCRGEPKNDSVLIAAALTIVGLASSSLMGLSSEGSSSSQTSQQLKPVVTTFRFDLAKKPCLAGQLTRQILRNVKIHSYSFFRIQ